MQLDNALCGQYAATLVNIVTFPADSKTEDWTMRNGFCQNAWTFARIYY